jgi:hypothetical protein
MASACDELWVPAAMRIQAARGWSLRPVAPLGRLRRDRRTWLAEGEPGAVIVKLTADPLEIERADWAAAALTLLRPCCRSYWRLSSFSATWTRDRAAGTSHGGSAHIDS